MDYSKVAQEGFRSKDADALFDHMVKTYEEPVIPAAIADKFANSPTTQANAPADPSAGEGPPPAGPPAGYVSPGDKMDHLAALMTQPLAPAEVLKAGNVPPPKTNARFVSKEDERDSSAQELHNALDAMIGLSDLYGGLKYVARGGGVLKLSQQDQAAEAFAQQADDAWKAVQDSMQGLLMLDNIRTEKWTSSKTGADLHSALLDKLFSRFNVGPDAVKKLDELLKSVADGLGAINWRAEKADDDIAYILRTHSIRRTNVGPPEDPIRFSEGVITLFHLKVKQSSFKTAWDTKASKGSVSPEYFKMEITSMEARVNKEIYNQNRAKLDQIANVVVGKDVAAYGKSISNTVSKD